MELRNSDLLNRLIEYGKTFDESNHRPMTVDRFILAILDTVNKKSGIEIKAGDESALNYILAQLFKDFTSKYTETRAAFEQNIKENQSEVDGWSFQQGLMNVKKKLSSTDREVLTPQVLLEYFVIKPSGLLKEYVKAGDYQGDFFDKDANPKESAFKMKKEVVLPDKDTEDKAKPENPKQLLSDITSNVKRYYNKLVSEVLGQEHAVSEFISGLFRSELVAETEKDRHRPRATFLFAGPPGVGKTYLAETAAELLNLPFKRFDMSEYCDKEASLEFIGSDAVYKNAKSGNFTRFINENPKSIILLDEIEKAHISIIHLFLQILDAGQIRDSTTDKTLSLKDTILVFTTNAGKQLYENSESGNLSILSRKVILKALEKDVNPQTKEPFFPPAICSRFASGNVVMFNHLPAETLQKIAVKQIQKNVRGFEDHFGIKVDIDENVYTSILLSEGGNVDGRTIKARAESFFHDEVFELFRLMESESVNASIQTLENIRITTELPSDNDEIKSLFIKDTRGQVLLFADEEITEQCRKIISNAEIIGTQDLSSAKSALKEREIGCVMIDLTFGKNGENKYLNYEDEDSPARDFLYYLVQYHSGVPVYLLIASENEISDEEKVSYFNHGISGIVTLTEDTDSFDQQMDHIIDELHQRNSIAKLSKANKLIRFETAQTLSDDGKSAQIKLFDYKMIVAVEAEDSENVLSGISKPDVTFENIIGAEDAKSELKYFVEYLKNPKKYMGTGVGAPKGVLLYGPPGTGKTMLAKAVAAASDVTYISAEGNQFVQSEVGAGAQKVHDIFRTARKYAPSIIFIDEVDTIARSRTGGNNTVANEEALTALLAEMDGFKKDNSKPVFVLAATNYDVEATGEKSLDPAVLRRFDRRIYVDLPNREERKSYLEMRFAKNAVFELSEEKIKNIAVRSTGMSLAELSSVIELALRTAIRDGNMKVTEAIFDEAFESFNSGEKKHWDEGLLKRVARHEAGHAFLCWYGGETPSYVTIVARSNHGGYMQHDDNEDKPLFTREELIAKVRTSLGGRAAEIVYYGEDGGVSTGASGDLVSATNLAHQMICHYGMSEKFGLAAIGSQAALNSNLTADIYEEINRILSRELQNAVDIIRANRSAIDALVEELMAKNHLNGDEIEAIFDQQK